MGAMDLIGDEFFLTYFCLRVIIKVIFQIFRNKTDCVIPKQTFMKNSDKLHRHFIIII